MWATLRQGDWSERRELPDATADVALDPAIAAAWKAVNNPALFRHREVLIGLSTGQGGFGVLGEYAWGGKRLGGFAAADFVWADPVRSRVAGGAVVRF
jgi:hypothetical protein